jgi:hypothetical protein
VLLHNYRLVPSSGCEFLLNFESLRMPRQTNRSTITVIRSPIPDPISMTTLIHCIYASRAAASFDEGELPNLLAATRANNAIRDITGMLLYVDRSFFQVLEGEKQAVDTTFEVISQDPPHTRVTRIIREPLARRHFAEWTMGFATATRATIGQLLGENDFFAEADCLERLDAGRAKKLLTAFRNGGWRADVTGVFDFQINQAAQRP